VRLRRFLEVGGEDRPVPAAAGDRHSADGELMGSWSATRWQYASRTRPDRIVDLVCDLHGSVTLSLSAGACVLTWDVPGHSSGSIGGAVALKDGALILRLHGADEADSVRYRVAAQTLALSSDGSAWDFGGDGEEPAEFVAVLVRL